MRLPALIAVVVFALMPIFGPFTAIMHGMGWLILPYLVGNFVYERSQDARWVLFVLPVPFVWYYGWMAWVMTDPTWPLWFFRS